jgi:Sigma-70, region 4
MEETCSLDVADRGGETLEAVGAYLNITRERVRQLENLIFEETRHTSPWLREHVEGPPGKRRLPVVQVAEDEPEREMVSYSFEELDEEFSDVEILGTAGLGRKIRPRR